MLITDSYPSGENYGSHQWLHLWVLSTYYEYSRM